MEFRPRNYAAEQESCYLPRVPADSHPLSSPNPSHSHLQVGTMDHEDTSFFDPLRVPDSNSSGDAQDVENTLAAGLSNSGSLEIQTKEWSSFKRFLMQRFSATKVVSVSPFSKAIMRSGKATEKSPKSELVPLEELDSAAKVIEVGVKTIPCQEYFSRLQELKVEISGSWHAGDRVTSLKLSIKVARLLMDTSVLQFYPILFVLVVDIMDMLGDMVWERIKQKAEYSEDGYKIGSLPGSFVTNDVCLDAKETCTNWFCKIGSIQELLPRIYLELAILPCWRFLLDQTKEILQRLVMMARGLADPLASAYCRLYIVYRAQKLLGHDIGYVIGCINDIKVQLLWDISEKHTSQKTLSQNRRLRISLIEPAIEYIMKCIFKDANLKQIRRILAVLGLEKTQSELIGNSSCVSIILHHLLKELPAELVSANAVEILHLIESSNDCSVDQCLNYRLLGFKLSESRSKIDRICEIVDEVLKVVAQYNILNEYLNVVDAYIDIILHNHLENHLDAILEGISKRAYDEGISEDESGGLQSICIKLVSHFKSIKDVFSLSHFVGILDVMHGSARGIVGMHILSMGMGNGYIGDPITIQLLFEISQVLHDGFNFPNVNQDYNQQLSRLISRFVYMVDYGMQWERHLAFLVKCRGAFGDINEVKEIIIHSSNCLAVKAIKDKAKRYSFFKACIAFAEVTIPSISACSRQLDLYLAAAEVALLGGLISHSDGLIVSAISCLKDLEAMHGSPTPVDVDKILTSIQKLCSFLVMVPGNSKQGVVHIPKCIFSFGSSESWITPKMRIKILCAIITLLATLSQTKLPYHANGIEVLGNDVLFVNNSSYVQELEMLAEGVLQKFVDTIGQEPSRAICGVMALEACVCIVSSLKVNHVTLPICSTLVQTARLCLNANDKYLQSTLNVLNTHFPISPEVAPGSSRPHG